MAAESLLVRFGLYTGVCLRPIRFCSTCSILASNVRAVQHSEWKLSPYCSDSDYTRVVASIQFVGVTCFTLLPQQQGQSNQVRGCWVPIGQIRAENEDLPQSNQFECEVFYSWLNGRQSSQVSGTWVPIGQMRTEKVFGPGFDLLVQPSKNINLILRLGL